MRALRPRSPRQTTAALIPGKILPATAVGPKPRQQVRRDATAMLRGRSDVVDRRDLLLQQALRVRERRAAGERLLGSGGTDDRRRDAAQRDLHGAARLP